MRQAAIDLGTNTCLLLIRDWTDGAETILHDESRVVRLGQGVAQTGELHSEAMTRAYECLRDYGQVLDQYRVPRSEVIAVATAQARDARNAKLFLEKIQQNLGLCFQVLSGDQEAKATFRGAALPGLDLKKMVVMDIGGGSTEVVSNQNGFSLPMGAVKVTEKFFMTDPVKDTDFWAAEEWIDQIIQEKIKTGQIPAYAEQFVAVAGTAVTLAMLQLGLSEYDRTKLDGAVITRGDAHRWVEELKWRSVQEREMLPGMEPKRADVMLAGSLIFWRVMECLRVEQAMISTRGLRYGVLNGS